MNNYLKKSLKVLTLLLVLTLMFSFSIIKAYDAPASAQFIEHELKYNVYKSGNTFTKNTFGVTQRIYNKEMFTAITNPCKDCVLGARLVRDGTDYTTKINTKMGNTATFDTTSGITGNYKLELMRSDYTLLNTKAYGTWYINS